uniref:Uncharacterized protein n=1 Tax=Arundo donax TaxID=35708 RepID=A0A0A9FW83_ARUDO
MLALGEKDTSISDRKFHFVNPTITFDPFYLQKELS